MRLFYLLLLSIALVGCNNDGTTKNDSARSSAISDIQMSYLSAEETGIDFTNTIEETNQFNFKTNEYVYNGGGVGVGDFNNDGLIDIFFSGNQVPNRLYLNKGDMKFEDASEAANIDKGGWCTGVNVADVNGDGYLDIYVARGNSLETNLNKRKNLLFINNGDATFKEMGEQYGVADPSYSIHSAFFDYDNDGDLDLLVTNHPAEYELAYKTVKEKNKNVPQFSHNRFYKNNGDNTFSEISDELGIRRYDHSLGIALSDLNYDGFTDIYIANDYVADDNIWINRQGKSFRDVVKSVTQHTSNFSMGIDIADINNDRWQDIFVVDMSSQDYFRTKAMMPSMNPKGFWSVIQQGGHYQYMRNALQLNMGNSTFSDVAQLSGLDQTDWSWSPLLVDFDHDGLRDCYVTNGYYRDFDEKDLQKRLDKKQAKNGGSLTWDQVLKEVKQTPLANQIFRNEGDLKFTNKNNVWLDDKATFSNGSAVADLDNDGDMDIVVNDLGAPSFIIKNEAEKEGQNFIQIKLKGPEKNQDGIGAKVVIKTKEGVQYAEMFPVRGFQSTSHNVIHFGLGADTIVEAIAVEWPGGKETLASNISANKRVMLSYTDAGDDNVVFQPEKANAFTRVDNYTNLREPHIENAYDDYKDQILLPHKMSRYGPAASMSDADKDGNVDIFIGGAAGQESKLFLHNVDLSFDLTRDPILASDKDFEDVGATFIDYDNDGDQDLYVVSGGYEFPENSPMYQDRLYINTGGKFAKAPAGVLPNLPISGSDAIAIDINKDGKMDLVVANKLIPAKYPFAPDSKVLINIGGKFEDQTEQIAPDLKALGLVNKVIQTNLNKDDYPEIVFAGEWMPLTIFTVKDGKLENTTAEFGFTDTKGWWFDVEAADIDGDGDMDLIGGNLGKNYKYKASEEEPFTIHTKDFDNNGTFDVVLGFVQDGVELPLRGLQCSSEQMPFVKEKYPEYNLFAEADLNDIYGDKLDGAVSHKVKSFASSIFYNEKGKFERKDLPNIAQISPIFGIEVHDFNNDGLKDIAAVGNLKVSEVETGNADAGKGIVLLNATNREFTYRLPGEVGFYTTYDSRDLLNIDSGSGKSILVIVNNNGPMQSFGYSKMQ